jgi:hypothetical protein
VTPTTSGEICTLALDEETQLIQAKFNSMLERDEPLARSTSKKVEPTRLAQKSSTRIYFVEGDALLALNLSEVSSAKKPFS